MSSTKSIMTPRVARSISECCKCTKCATTHRNISLPEDAELFIASGDGYTDGYVYVTMTCPACKNKMNYYLSDSEERKYFEDKELIEINQTRIKAGLEPLASNKTSNIFAKLFGN